MSFDTLSPERLMPLGYHGDAFTILHREKISRTPDLSNKSETTPGLSTAATAARLKQEGFNELPSTDKRGFLRIFREVMRQPMFALLIGGGVVYLLLGDRIETLLLLLFASLSLSITIVQETRSENVLEALRNLASPRALVIRDGRRLQIAGREVVPVRKLAPEDRGG